MKTIVLMLFWLVPLFVAQAQQAKYFEKVIEWNYFTSAFSIVQKANGNFVVTGETDSINSGWASIYLLETDNNGNFQKGTEYTTDSDERVAYDLSLCEDGIVMGGFSGLNRARALFVKTTEEGIFVDSTSVGTSQYTNHCNTICSARDGGFLLGGEIQPYDSTVVAPPTHPYLIKLDAAGNKLWDTIYYQYGPPYYASVRYLLPTTDGNYYALISNQSNYYYSDIVLLKIDEYGTILKQVVISYAHKEDSSSISLTNDGGVIIGARSSDNFASPSQVYGLVIKLDSNLVEQWHKDAPQFYKIGISGSVVQTPDGGYLATGGNIANGNVDVEVVK